MGIGASLFLITLGLILWLAVTATVQGIDINLVGLILVIVGGIGLLLSLVFWSTLGRLRNAPHDHDGLERPVRPAADVAARRFARRARPLRGR